MNVANLRERGYWSVSALSQTGSTDWAVTAQFFAPFLHVAAVFGTGPLYGTVALTGLDCTVALGWTVGFVDAVHLNWAVADRAGTTGMRREAGETRRQIAEVAVEVAGPQSRFPPLCFWWVTRLAEVLFHFSTRWHSRCCCLWG